MSNIQPHIRCGNINIRNALLPGDPGRVDRVKGFLENPVELAFNREFKTISGSYKGVEVLVTSTGIGGPSLAIAVEELRNIGVRNMIRIGSCGALQDNLKTGDLIIANGAVRNDGLSETYIEKGYPAVPDSEFFISLVESARRLDYSFYTGIIRSHDSFYTDQEEKIDNYWSSKEVLGSDMESAALFVLGGLRGLKVASILNVVVDSKGNLEEGINEYVDGLNTVAEGESREITLALEAIVHLNKKNK